jgi:hypothetical protein
MYAIIRIACGFIFFKQIKSLVFILIQLKNSTVYHFTSHHPKIYIFFSLFELLDSLTSLCIRIPFPATNIQPQPIQKNKIIPLFSISCVCAA